MSEKFKNKKVAVLYGGISGEREVSLRSGKKVFDSLVSQGINAVLVDTKEDFIPILKEGKFDIACIMLHGRGGEDGSIQGILETLGIPYTGTKVLGSAIGMHKVASKKIWKAAGVPTPKYIEIDTSKDISAQCEIIRKRFPFPLVVKPTCEGSSLGVAIVKEPAGIEEIVRTTTEKYGETFVEEFIKGVEITVGVIEIKGQPKALPILELSPKAEFYDYDAKYTQGMTDFIIPARLPKLVYYKAQETSVEAFKSVYCSGFARVDMIVDSDGIPFVTEVNTIPGMTDLSDLPAEADADGISYDALVLHILESAL